MRRFLSAMALTSLVYGGTMPKAHAEVNFSLSIGDTDGFYMGLSNYYDVPQDRVSMLVDRGLSYDEVTVALHISEVAGVDPFEVADLRLSGMPWIEVAHYYGLGADIFYVSDEDPIGPYVTYYEPFRTHPRAYWPSLVLSDVAIINLSNLRYECQHYGVPAREVMGYRARGENFLKVNRELFRERGQIPRRPMARRPIRAQVLPQELRVEARAKWKDMPMRQRSQPRNETRIDRVRQPRDGQRQPMDPQQRVDRREQADKRPQQSPAVRPQMNRKPQPRKQPKKQTQQTQQAPPARQKMERTQQLNNRQQMQMERNQQMNDRRQMQMERTQQMNNRQQMQVERTQQMNNRRQMQEQRTQQLNERQQMRQVQPQRAPAQQSNARARQMTSEQTQRPRAAARVAGKRHRN